MESSGFRVQGSGFRVQGSGFRVQGSRFRVQGSGFKVRGSGCRVQGAGFGGHPRPKVRRSKGSRSRYPRINKGGGANQAGVFWVPAPPDVVYAL